MMQRGVFDAIGGFDPELAVAFNDVDLCLRARDAGLRVVLEERVELTHHESMSRAASKMRLSASL